MPHALSGSEHGIIRSVLIARLSVKNVFKRFQWCSAKPVNKDLKWLILFALMKTVIYQASITGIKAMQKVNPDSVAILV